jgi:SAM-dependent methyltransferase
MGTTQDVFPRSSAKASAPARAWQSLRSRGAAETGRIAVREARRKAMLAARQASERRFDRRFRVSTRENFRHPDVGVEGTALADAVMYEPTPPADLKRLVRELGIDARAFTFVDIGSGRGRTLFVAAQLGFRRAVGVELAREMHESALANMQTYRGPRADFELHCVDAAEYELPLEPVVIFMYDTCGERTMSAIAANLDRSLREHPRPAYVIYHQAHFRHLFAGLDTLESRRDALDWAIYATPTSGA